MVVVRERVSETVEKHASSDGGVPHGQGTCAPRVVTALVGLIRHVEETGEGEAGVWAGRRVRVERGGDIGGMSGRRCRTRCGRSS